jgi:hypothetical protein
VNGGKVMEKEDKEVDWILENGLQFAEGQFGHQVVVIQNRKVIFRVKGEEMPAANALSQAIIRPYTPKKDQIKDITKALQLVKDKFGDPEFIRFHECPEGDAISALHFKNGLILYVYGFTAF